MSTKIIAFEGIDGCGKTTLLNNVINALPPISKHALASLSKPYTDYTKILREGIFTDIPRDAIQYAFGVLAICAREYIEQIIIGLDKKPVKGGNYIFCDRYILSALAYSNVVGGSKVVDTYVPQLRKPDLTLLVNTPTLMAITRAEKGGTTVDAYDTDWQLQDQVASYMLCAAQDDPSIVVLDGTQSAEYLTKLASSLIINGVSGVGNG